MMRTRNEIPMSKNGNEDAEIIENSNGETKTESCFLAFENVASKTALKFCLHMIFKFINKDYFCLQMISVYFVLHTSTTILKPPVLACHIEPGSPPV